MYFYNYIMRVIIETRETIKTFFCKKKKDNEQTISQK